MILLQSIPNRKSKRYPIAFSGLALIFVLPNEAAGVEAGCKELKQDFFSQASILGAGIRAF